MDLYVLRFRDYPCIPILFGWDCNPQSYCMEGSGSLHKYNRPIDPISVLSKFIRSQYNFQACSFTSWSWWRQQKILTKTYSKNQIQRLKQAGFPNDKFPQSWTYNSELWDMFVPKNGSPFSRKANFQVPDAALQGCMVSETYPSNSKNGETWWDLLQKSTWLFVCQTELAPKML